MNDIAMLVLLIAIIVFVVALIVLVIHFIGTVKKVNKTIDDLQPTIESANKMLEDIQPALKRVDPLMERVSLTVDAVNLEIMRADTILADISEVTSVASDAAGRVADITDAPLNMLAAATDKVRDIFGSSKEKKEARDMVRRASEEQEASQATASEDEDFAQENTDSFSDSRAEAIEVEKPMPQEFQEEFKAQSSSVAQESPNTSNHTTPVEATAEYSSISVTNAAPVEGAPMNNNVQVDYTPDFEPDDDLEVSSEAPVSEIEEDSYFLFYTDDEGVKEGKSSE